MTAAALLSAVLARLRADAVLAADLGGRIWDCAPRDVVFPHLVVEEISSRDRSGVDARLDEHRLALRVLSRVGGRREALTLLARVEALLVPDDPVADGLALDGARVVLLRREAADVRLQRDRLTAEATLRLIALVEPD
ncbi:MAG: DUF3168 domain-containing protein [Siculibacillus sp.]